MPRRSRLPHSPHHLSIYDEDWEFLLELFGPNGVTPTGVSEVIREIVHRKVGAYRAQYRGRLDASAGARAAAEFQGK
jgi:hypothetical protein